MAHPGTRPGASRVDEDDPMRSRAGRALVATLIGAGPGLLLVLFATFAIEGEMQLTVGAPGILIAVVGGIGGLLVGLRTKPAPKSDRPAERTPG